MSVFGSLFTAVSGMSAQSDSISMISNNIANVNTVGYKRTDAAFASLVTSQSQATAYSSGSVRSIQNARINQQGILQQSSSGTDIALSGNGFFVVKPSATDPLAEPLYTRAGSFSEDSSGVLRNAAGFYLMGWPLDQNGNLPASQADISSLVPVDVAFQGGLTQPTTTASMGLNLKSSETQTAYPVANGFVPDFTRGLKVFDSLGAGHDLTLNFKKLTSPTATATGIVNIGGFTGPIVGNVLNVNAGDQFSVQVGALPAVNITITANTTVADMLAQINAITDPVTNLPMAYAKLDGNGFLTVKARNPGDALVLTDVTGAPLVNAALGMGASPVSPAIPAAPNMLAALDPSKPVDTEGWWQLEFVTPTGAVVNSGQINFTGNGLLNAVPDINRQINVDLPNIDWSNGSTLQDISFDMAGFTEFSGDYNVITSVQNGAELGLRTAVSIDKDGFVTAQFSNGQSSRIFKVPIATFANANGLDSLTGNVFRESNTSGSFNLREAGKGSAGTVAGGSLEASNVDLADEFAKMIVTQRAYSANTKVISTADQMTQELLQLR